MKTKFIILGCGNSMGNPRIDGYWGESNKKNSKNERSRCSALIKKGKNLILIDTSPDIRNQLLTYKIKSISSVIYTHEHSDQTNGIFELRPFAVVSGDKKNTYFYGKKTKRINVYGNFKTITLLKKRFDYCFKKRGIYPPIVKGNIVKKSFYLGKNSEKIKFDSFQVKHGKVNVTGYIFNKTAYLSDCNDLAIVNNKRLRNLNYIIIDCLKKHTTYAHFGLNDCLYINKMLKPKKMILTNLSQEMDYNTLVKKMPKNVIPAYDGLTINL